MTFFNDILQIKRTPIFQQHYWIYAFNQISDIFFTKLDTDYRKVKDRDLAKLDEVESILYTNDTNNFTCRMATYLFLPKLQFSLSFSNGTTEFSEGIEKYIIKFIIMIKNTLDFENEQIPPFHDFEAVWTVTVPLGAVAVNCYAFWWNSSDIIKSTRRFITRGKMHCFN